MEYQPQGFCPKCGYAIDVGICSECGSVVSSAMLDRAPLARRKRRLILRAVAIAALVTAAWIGVAAYRSGSWVRALPDWLLLACQSRTVGVAHSGLSGVDAEILRRLGLLSAADQERVIRQTAIVPVDFGLPGRFPSGTPTQVVCSVQTTPLLGMLHYGYGAGLWVEGDFLVDGRVRDHIVEEGFGVGCSPYAESMSVGLYADIPPLQAGSHVLEFNGGLRLTPSSDSSVIPIAIRQVIQFEQRPLADFARAIAPADLLRSVAEGAQGRVQRINGSGSECEVGFDLFLDVRTAPLVGHVYYREAGQVGWILVDDWTVAEPASASCKRFWGGWNDAVCSWSAVDIRFVPDPVRAWTLRLDQYFGGEVVWTDLPIHLNRSWALPENEPLSWNGEAVPDGAVPTRVVALDPE
ncbi:MAG: zinc ribbon domain-containing protein [Phycisphaerales bacterium]|nr:zinc ribbon domain-containing protein [Phycisphaerales bacterium]